MKHLVLSFLLVLSFALAQDDNPVSYRIETYVVSEVAGEERFAEASTARPGQIVEYRLFVSNTGETTLPEGTVMVTGPVPEGTRFVANSATPTSERVLTEFSEAGSTFSEAPLRNASNETIDPESYGAVRWTLLTPMEPGQEESFFYRVTVE